jgi:multiple sugar transport system ATP-binding protein
VISEPAPTASDAGFGGRRNIMAAIQLSSVVKTYPDGFEAVKGVSLEIPDGSLCVLVGPSGCGKSTTLRMVAGLEDITGGEILIGGRVVNDVHPAERDIAMVFQNYALYPNMSVYANMAFPLKMRGVARAEIDKRVRAAAETLGLTPMLERRPAALSGGQRQRVAVGRAIVREPKAYLFDEPLSNLDAKLRVTTRAEIKALQLRLGTTTIYVTHDQEEAMSLADLMVVMAAGKVQQAGPPMELYLRPINRFVATFVGLPPMNMLEGVVERQGRAWVFVEGSKDLDGRACVVHLPERLCAAIDRRLGATALDRLAMTLGIRPQAFRLSTTEAARWSLGVSAAEAMGEHVDVFVGTSKHPHIVARLLGQSIIRRGEKIDLAIDIEHVHLFEPGEFGVNIGLA